MYFGYFVLSLSLSVLITPLVHMIMYKQGIVDHPRSEKRKIHKKKIPLGGGWAIFISFFVVVALLLFGSANLGIEILPKHIYGLFLGSLVLMVGGYYDDKYSLLPKKQMWFPVIATLLIIAFGIGPHMFSNPAGGLIDLSKWTITIDGFGNWVVLADALVFIWLMGMMFTTKFLDGLDGLVSGVVTIGALVLFFLTQQEQWFQPEVSLLAIVFAGACVGFLVWNWHPAKIFLGEGGSLFTGFVLGTLAIISGAKIATTLLVMGLPALDVLRVIIRRIQKKKSIFKGDNEHLHFKLVARGMKQWQAVLLMYAISFLFGLSALFLQTTQKLTALLLLFVLMVLIGIWFAKRERVNSL